MKKNIPYIASAFLLVVLILVIIFIPFRLPKKMDERTTLRQKDKIPYGTFAAFHLLPQLFPNATVSTSDHSPKIWGGDSLLSSNQAVILTARFFDPSNEEMRNISRFLNRGNYVLLITNSFSYNAAEHFGVTGSDQQFYSYTQDSLRVGLKKPFFEEAKNYVYPGKKFDAFIEKLDAERAFVLGTNETGDPNFLQFQAGKGKLYIHLAPLAFSNYFILHKRNMEYFENVMSVIPANIDKITWNEYYLIQRKKTNEKEPSVLNVLWQYPSFKWALLTALATLLLYTLVEMRRRQRAIPVLKRPVNDSLDFVRTLGRLYYDKKDHRNLAKKMASYFLEEVRTRYHLQTQNRDADFVTELHARSGHPVKELQEIVFFIENLEIDQNISEEQLAHFYQQLNSFYQNT